MDFTPILNREYFNNSVQDYLITSAIIVAGFLLIALFRKFLIIKASRWAASTESKLDDHIISGLSRFGIPIARFLIIYWGISYLTLSLKTQRLMEILTAVLIAYFALRLASTSIQLGLHSFLIKQENGESKIKQVASLMILVNILIWTLGAVFLFDNLGFNVSAILTGVGIGGIAIALAAQNIIGDLFNYFVIFFDRPFEVGDFINLDDKSGTIEFIGLKTTRMRSLSGEQIVLSNSDLTKSRVHNFKRLETRRIAFTITVIFHTAPEKLKQIPAIIEAIINELGTVRFERAHLARLTEYGILYEVVYHVPSPDYIIYMNIQQAINLKLIDAFAKEKIHFLIREDQPGVWDNN